MHDIKVSLATVSEIYIRVDNSVRSSWFRRVANTDVIEMEMPQRKMAHFHYEADTDIDLAGVKVLNISVYHQRDAVDNGSGDDMMFGAICAELELESNAIRWKVHSDWSGLLQLDAALHTCLFNRRESELVDLHALSNAAEKRSVEEISKTLEAYLHRFCELFGNRLVCSTVLDILELGPRGNHVVSADSVDAVDAVDAVDSVDSGTSAAAGRKHSHEPSETINLSSTVGKKPTGNTLRNEPAVGAAHVIKDYVAQSSDELTLSVGEMISVIEMRRGETRWRGKKWQEKANIRVGYFPPECVQLLGVGKQPAEVSVVTPKDSESNYCSHLFNFSDFPGIYYVLISGSFPQKSVCLSAISNYN